MWRCDWLNRRQTWAAEGSRALQPPSNDRIYSCRCLWCYTPVSRCFLVNGWASAPRRLNPRSRGYLETHLTIRLLSSVFLKVNNVVSLTDLLQWIQARRGRIWVRVGEVHRWWAASSSDSVAGAGRPETDCRRSPCLWNEQNIYGGITAPTVWTVLMVHSLLEQTPNRNKWMWQSNDSYVNSSKCYCQFYTDQHRLALFLMWYSTCYIIYCVT